MKANCWYGKNNVQVVDVPDPKILNRRDAVVKITTTAICGSDLHLYNGFVPTMEKGDILGHEFMGEVVEVGPEVQNLKEGDRVVASFPISCGRCFFCQRELFSLCENSNPNAWIAQKLFGHSPAGIYGYTHMLGGFAGGQAEYARVPFADVGTIKVPEGLRDEQVLFLSDIFPTGYMAAENCNIQPGDTIAVWGCGPVGQFAIKSAFLLGAERVAAIDRFMACRKGGTVSVPGVYGGFDDKIPLGSLMNKALTIKTGQTHVQHYMRPLLERIENGEIDPSFVITHRLRLADAPQGYETFLNKEDGCVKVVLTPGP
jgi:threonine dehydrogenase-like Zn-dependent dehydrogenase